MKEQLINNGGLQYIPQIAAVQQIVYLDFDGELTSYDGEILTLDSVEVQNSSLTAERIANILAALNEKYASQNVVFVTERPQTADYSTIFIGKTTAFDPYGNFAGLAETIDTDNQNKTDKAFINLDASATDSQIITTITHETDHLLGTLDHGGKGLEQYACTSYNNTLTGEFNGNYETWRITEAWFWDSDTGAYYLAGQEYHDPRCSSIDFHYSKIANAVLTSGTFSISAGQSITSSVIGNGAHVTLALPELVSSGTPQEYIKSAWADTVTIASGGGLDVFVNSATNITIQRGGTIAHNWTGYSLTHHGNDDAFLTDFSSEAKVFGRIDNFNFNGEINTYGAKLNNVTVGKEPNPLGGYYYGYLYMHDNSVAENTTVEGGMYVSSGTSALNTTISGGTLSAYDGAVIDTLTMIDGSAHLSSQTEVIGATVVSGGILEIANMNFSTPLTVLNSGVVDLYSGTLLTGARISSGGIIGLDSGRHTTSDTVVLSGGTQLVNYWAEANGTNVSSGGSMLLYGVASNTTVDNGYLYAYDDNAFDYDTVLRNSSIQHLEYAEAHRTHISSGAMQSVGYGADTFDVIVSAGGTQTVHGANNYGSGTTSNTTVYGVQSAVSNARLSNTIVYGSQYLGSKVSAYDNHLAGGTMTAVSGAYVNRLYVSSGGLALLESTVSAVSGTILSGGVISNGCFANVVISSGGLLKDGAPAYYGGVLTLQAGGSATGITLDNQDTLHVVVASDTLLQATRNGSAYNTSNGLFSDLTIYASHSIDIAAGAVARNVILEGHGALNVAGSAEAIVNDIYGSLSVLSGGEAANVSNYGILKVCDGGVLENTQNNVNYGVIYISSGGFAKDTYINRGNIYISSGGVTSNLYLMGGNALVSSGGKAFNTLVDAGYSLEVSSGGTATIAFNPWQGTVSSASGAEVSYLERDAKVYVGSYGLLSKTDVLENQIISSGSSAIVYDGGVAVGNTVQGYNAILRISSGGIAVNNTIHEYMTVCSGGTASGNTASGGIVYILNGGLAQNTAVVGGGKIYISSGGTLHNVNIERGSMYISSGGKITGSFNLGTSSYVGGNSGCEIEFDLSNQSCESAALINDFSKMSFSGAICTIKLSDGQAFGTYALAENASRFSGTFSSFGTEDESFGTITINGDTVRYKGIDYTLLRSANGTLQLTMSHQTQGDCNSVSWADLEGSGNYIVEYSTDNFATVFSVTLSAAELALDTIGLPAGNYKWRVRQENDFIRWSESKEIVAQGSAEPAVFESDNDGDRDLFFARSGEIWQAKFHAQHMGCGSSWEGTGETAILTGKNRITDVFAGSADASILVLTDDANGDALFVDDIYTALGDQARFSQIDEIRAGAGDDIVDMTSQRFAYNGNGVKIYGGAGDDTVWANNGSNILFGDAGNDRIVGGCDDDTIIGGAGNDSMHGGGGYDIFTFGGNWGNDTVEQLASGVVTLWFENGSNANWNSETLTYSDGVNSVTVTGCANVTLWFGGDLSALPAGGFDDAASQKIFEDNNSGMLA